MKDENEKKIMCTVLWNTTQYILLSCKDGLLAETYPTLFLPDTPPPITLSSTTPSSYTPSPVESSPSPSPSPSSATPSYAPSSTTPSYSSYAPSSATPSYSSYAPSSTTPSYSSYTPSSSINTLLNILSPSPHVGVHIQNNNTYIIIPVNTPSSVFTTPSSTSYNHDYHFLWLLLVPLLVVGGCLYNRKYRNNSTVCPKTNDKKYESDNGVNIEEGCKRNKSNLGLPQESNETIKTRSESPHQYPSSPRRRRIGRLPKTLNIPPVVNSQQSRHIKSTHNSQPSHQHLLPRPRHIKSAVPIHDRPPSKTLPDTPGNPRPPTVHPQHIYQQPRPPTVPPRKNKKLLLSI